MNLSSLGVAGEEQELLRLSAAGDREAFGQLVRRYQSVVCAVAYAGCGDLARSEDLAQEAFVAAWKQLPQLREQGRFKAWLCGIARQRAASARRQDTREPSAGADSLEGLDLPAVDVPSPAESASSRDEEQQVWAVLARLPSDYREPLVLYYREGQSVAKVADTLELSEEAVRQRLSRGRALLRDRVADLIEGALGRSGPGPAFTASVLAVLPLAMPASAGAVTAATLKAGAGIPSVLSSVWLLSFLGPVVGLAGAWIGYRASYRQAGSDPERRLLKWTMVVMSLLTAGFIAALLILVWGWSRWFGLSALQFAIALTALILFFTAGTVVAGLMIEARRRRLVQGEVQRGERVTPTANPGYREYRTKGGFLGLPWIHVCVGSPKPGQRGMARGWIAIGDIAFGPLCAVGGIAFGGIAFGGLAVGFISLAGVGLGVLTMAGLAGGIWSAGGLAGGVQAFGGLAIASSTALGGLAIAKHCAVGGLAYAAHANDAIARATVEHSGFFRAAQSAARYSPFMSILGLLPILLLTRKRAGKPDPNQGRQR